MRKLLLHGVKTKLFLVVRILLGVPVAMENFDFIPVTVFHQVGNLKLFLFGSRSGVWTRMSTNSLCPSVWYVLFALVHNLLEKIMGLVIKLIFIFFF